MNNVERFLQLLKTTEASALVAEGGAEALAILRAIEGVSAEGNTEELDRQIGEFLSLSPKWYDPGNVFLGFDPKLTTIQPELRNEIKNATLAVLREIEANKANEKDQNTNLHPASGVRGRKR